MPASGRRGSIAAAALRRRLKYHEVTGGVSLTNVDPRNRCALEDFLADQRQRVLRTTTAHERHAVRRLRELERANAGATHAEVVTRFHVTIRGSVGSDAHLGDFD